MLAYTIRRVIAGIVLLVVMTMITFVLFFLSPTDPARLTCGKICTPLQISTNRHVLGYDQPITVQYGRFLKGLVKSRDFPDDKEFKRTNPQGVTHCPAPCLGFSPFTHTLVRSEIAQRLPVSLSESIYAFVLWIVVGVLGGIIAALYRGRWPDRVLVGAALIGYSFPVFFIGLTLYTYLAIKHQFVPIPEYIPFNQDPVGFLRGMFLPAVTLASLYAAAYVRLTRAYVLEAMGEDYLRTARAKGLSERKVIFKHTLRGALTPITTIAGLDLGALVATAAVTETLFNLDGLGKLTVSSATNSDLPTEVAIVLVGASFIILANIVVDLLYGFIDPRVRY